MLSKSPKHRYGIWSVIEDPWMKVNEEEDISSPSECSKVEDSLEIHKTETSRITGALCESPTLFKLNNKLSQRVTGDVDNPLVPQHSPTFMSPRGNTNVYSRKSQNVMMNSHYFHGEK